MMNNFITDFFGNEIRVGDKVVCSIGNHAGLCFGKVTRLGNTGTTVDIQIIYAPYNGYWNCANKAIGTIKKNVKVLINREEHDYHDRKKDTFITAYSYCVKYDFLETCSQYKLLNTE